MSNKDKLKSVIAKAKELLNKVGVTDEHLNSGISYLKNAKENAENTIKEKAKKPIGRTQWIIFAVVAFLVFRVVIAPIFAPKKITYEKVYTVLTDKVEAGSLQEYFRVNGDVLANNAMNILPDAAGKLVRYTVEVGQQVRKGDIVAYVDPSKPGFVFELSPVRAPMAGTITRLPLELGNTVATSDSVAQMGEIDQLKVETYIPERLLANVRVGTKAKVEVIAYPGVFYDAEIEEVAPVLDPATRTTYVKLFIANIDDKIRAGMFAGLKILTVNHDKALIVPISALITRSGKQYLAVVNRPMKEVMKGVSKSAKTPEGTRVSFKFDYDVRIVPVELGGKADGNVVVLSGIKEGDVIVTSGQSMLLEGSKIEIITEADVASEEIETDKKTDTNTGDTASGISSKLVRLKAIFSDIKMKLLKLTGKGDLPEVNNKEEDNVPILLPPEENSDEQSSDAVNNEETATEQSSQDVEPDEDNQVVSSPAVTPVAPKVNVSTPAPAVSATPVAPTSQPSSSSPVTETKSESVASTPDVSTMGSDDL